MGIQRRPLVLFSLLGLSLGAVASSWGERPKDGPKGSPSVEVAGQDPGVIGPKRALTFVGPRAGEGYFSADGKKMIFQSEREPGNPFYQIYSLDLQTGATERLSTGSGKTTCSWFHPSMKKALYASTHLDPQFAQKSKSEVELRNSNQKRKYSWDYDETYDLFEVDLKTKKNKRLTSSRGYDAEGSYSPDGRLIAFASNRSAYEEPMTAEEKKLFEQDPSLMMEIYIMDADGKNVRRMTHTRGYDGGPFFSADGSRLTWRRFSPDGRTAEIMSMRVDGKDERTLTRLGAMSWAPFFHPSGDYVIFTSNLLGYDNFELYIVDSKGEKDPVRVSYLPGFDGLPVFSPDGKQLSWTHRGPNGESQIFLADWDDQKARRLLGISPRPPISQELAGGYNPQDARRVVEYLASDRLEGRMTGSSAEKEYSEALAALFQSLGYQSWEKNSYLQAFEFASGVKLGENNRLDLQIKGKTVPARAGEDFTPLSFSNSEVVEAAPVVFAGYGIVAPGNESQATYDSYKGLDVKGKWVLAFRDIPENVPNPRRVFLNTFSRPHHKALVARERGAKGLLLVNGPNSGSKQKLMALRFEGAGFAGTALPVLSVSDAWAEKLLASTGRTLKSLQSELDQQVIPPDWTEKWPDGLIPEARLSAEVQLIQEKSKGMNVLAVHRVPGAQETLVIGAHGDHLGRGIQGSSLAQGSEQGQIHFGADDNASGVAALIQVAQAMSQDIQKGRWKPRQNILFAVWSGEEIGLLGSNSFLKAHHAKISAYLNMDMVGRLRDQLILQGTASAKEWPALIEKWNAQNGKLSLSLVSDPFVPSDAMAFYMAGVPSLHFFTGAHGEYHTPRDTPATLNYEGISEVARLVGRIGEEIASSTKNPLTYMKVESSRKSMEGRSFRIFLGTVPDYTQEGIKGVRISGTSKNSPAEKTGLLAGDVIVELGGLKIENLYDYVYALQALKAGQEVPLKVQRGDRVQNLRITPALKE